MVLTPIQTSLFGIPSPQVNNNTLFHLFSSCLIDLSIEWSPGKVVFYLDDKVLGTSTTKVNFFLFTYIIFIIQKVPYNPMHYVLQTETALSGGPPKDSTQGHVHVDWVAVYTYGGPSPGNNNRNNNYSNCVDFTYIHMIFFSATNSIHLV